MNLEEVEYIAELGHFRAPFEFMDDGYTGIVSSQELQRWVMENFPAYEYRSHKKMAQIHTAHGRIVHVEVSVYRTYEQDLAKWFLIIRPRTFEELVKHVAERI